MHSTLLSDTCSVLFTCLSGLWLGGLLYMYIPLLKAIAFRKGKVAHSTMAHSTMAQTNKCILDAWMPSFDNWGGGWGSFVASQCTLTIFAFFTNYCRFENKAQVRNTDKVPQFRLRLSSLLLLSSPHHLGRSHNRRSHLSPRPSSRAQRRRRQPLVLHVYHGEHHRDDGHHSRQLR